MAEQWVLISKWGIDDGDSAMVFRGPLSQDQACSCATNTPTQAWNQMVNKMDDKPPTIVDMDYSMDIDWH